MYNGLTSENFNLSGNIPVCRILLNMYVRGDKTYGALNFRIWISVLIEPGVSNFRTEEHSSAMKMDVARFSVKHWYSSTKVK
jgi:hypothetical protein